MSHLSCLARLQGRLISDSRAWGRVKAKAASEGLSPSVWIADHVWSFGASGTLSERAAAAFADLSTFIQSI